MRWGQLTLVENDPPRLNVKYWLDYFQRCHCDAVTLSQRGNVRGPSDWIAVDEHRKVRRHWAMPDLYVTCPHGPHHRLFTTSVIREIVSLYGVDGVFANRWANSRSIEVCYCEHCREGFRNSYRRDPPQKRDARDRVWRDYILWHQESVLSLMKMWDSEIRKVKPGSIFIPNSAAGAQSVIDWAGFGDAAEVLVSDHQGRTGVIPPWDNGQRAKVVRSFAGRKPMVGIFSPMLATPYRWIHSVKSDAEQQIWMAEGTANGFRPWFGKFGGVQEDERWMGVVERFFRWHHSAEKYLRDREPAARMAIVYSQQSALYYGGERAKELVSDPLDGMYHALIEARIPFEMVHDRKLDAGALARFKLLLLPNIAALSDGQCQQLRAFVKSGGSLLATFETSLYDEWGTPRRDFGLADVFGIHYRGTILKHANSYLAFHGAPGKRHPILAGLDAAAFTPNGTRSVDTEATGGGQPAPITLIPGYPDLPMEFVYERSPRPSTPQVFLREPGKSRTVYFPMDLDRTYWDVLLQDHGHLLANAVRWAMNEDPPAAVTGPGILDVTVWYQRDAVVVHLVNFTNPMMMKGPIRELVPVGKQQVRVRSSRRCTAVRLLVGKTEPEFIQRPEWIEFTIPSVLDHEVIALDLV